MVKDVNKSKSDNNKKEPVLLLILDGWGIRNSKQSNAIKLAKTPNYDKLIKKWPNSQLKAAGRAVGLPKGYMGNSEVGHSIIGAGRVIDTDLVRINKAIRNKSFFKDKALLQAIKHCKKNKTKLHLMGLLSDAGVHSHIDHLFALLKLAKEYKLKEVYIHAFLDGRDTPPNSAKKYLKKLEKFCEKNKIGTLATMMGRFYAMDRDNRWNREHKAYDAMVNCIGRKRSDPYKTLDECYARGESDEFVKPTILLRRCVVEKGDSIIFFNFRSDRARELTRAFVKGEFNGFKRKQVIDLKFVSLTQYDSLVKIPVAFKPLVTEKTLGEVVSLSSRSQLRLAETEKWAHVTYFFNGLCECIFPHEKRIHIPSRKVKTYDKTPQMKVNKITSTFLKNKDNYDFFVVNFANGDMIGHTGNIKAAIKAIEAIDSAIRKIVENFKGKIFITADHGNCEDMTEGCKTCHSTDNVPFIAVNMNGKLKNGQLSDVAPTILKAMNIKKPIEMTGKNLLLPK